MSFIEKVGKKIPDPVIIFMILYAIVMIASIFMGGMEFETLAADGEQYLMKLRTCLQLKTLDGFLEMHY